MPVSDKNGRHPGYLTREFRQTTFNPPWFTFHSVTRSCACDHVVGADIKKCFDSIDHDVLLDLVARKIADQDLLNLLRHWLNVDILDFHDLFPLTAGVPQGQSLSPLLANIYLDTLDKRLEAFDLCFVRYADDIIIMENSSEKARKALEIVERSLLDPLHLEIKPAKTQFVSLDEGFSFLGFRVETNGATIQQNRIERIENILQPLIKTLGHPDSSFAQRADALMRINASIRGFRNYFMLPDEKQILCQLARLDNHIKQSASFHLPAEIRKDPAWVCRERFFVGKPGSLDNSDQVCQTTAANGCAYPETPSNLLPACWIIEDEIAEFKDPDAVSGAEGHKAQYVKNPEKEGNDSRLDTILDSDGRLYVLVHGTYLTQSGDDFVLKKRKAEVFRCALSDIVMVFIQGFGITLSVALQLRLTDLRIPVVMAAPVGFPLAVLNTVVSGNSSLRVWQVLKRDDPYVLCAGLNMIAAKVGNQAALLRYFAKYRNTTNPRLGSSLNSAADEIRRIAGTIRTLDPARSALRSMAMGLEGQAGAVYWKQIVNFLPSGFGFSGRRTRGAQDPVNQCLNYMYALLYGEVWHAVVRTGLDPYFGLIHGSQRDKGSLVFDLIEEFRAPFVDRLVFAMMGRGFQPEIGYHRILKTTKRRQLVRSFKKSWSKTISWHSQKLTPAAILDNQTRSLKKLFLGEGSYHPYRMRW